MNPNVHFIHKTTACLLATLIAVQSLMLITHKPFVPGIPEALSSLACLAIVAAGVLCLAVWQYRERRHGGTRLRFVPEKLIVYCTCLVFFSFGLMKLLSLHMNSSLVFEDMPAGSLSGYHLMDYFFGKAPAFKLLIGILQLAGAALLLFRRTRLAGIFVLLPLALNIALMDYFYRVGFSITFLAASLTCCLVYLLWAEREKLSGLFAMPGRWTQPGRSSIVLQNGLRCSALAIPLLMLVPARNPARNSLLNGKYEVLSFRINGQPAASDAAKGQVLSAVYFDENDDCVFRYNSHSQLKIGHVSYSAATGQMCVVWRYPKLAHDTLNALTRRSGDTLVLSGSMGVDGIELRLIQSELPHAD